MSKAISEPHIGNNVFFRLRYFIALILIIAIIIFSYWLHTRGHTVDKVASIATGCFVVLTLFFSVLSYEYNAQKNRLDSRTTRELLTYNSACEWHKSPLVDYQQKSIRHEQIFTSAPAAKKLPEFLLYIDDLRNIEYKTSLKAILNYLEATSIGVNKGIINKDFIKEFFKSIFKIYYCDYYFYILHLRNEKGVQTIWINFTALTEEWHEDLCKDVTSGTILSTIILQ